MLALKTNPRFDYLNYRQLDKRYKGLLNEAKRIMKTGYNPYSGSRVGAAILTRKGNIISASCVVPKERNANVCAERAAIVKANSYGERDFIAIAVFGKSGSTRNRDYMFTPCGTCRQFISEFSKLSGKDIDVIMSNLGMTRILVLPISKLLPLAFQ